MLDRTVWHIDRLLATQYCAAGSITVTATLCHSLFSAVNFWLSGSNNLPRALAAITSRRGPLYQTAAMTTGILSTPRGLWVWATHHYHLTHRISDICPSTYLPVHLYCSVIMENLSAFILPLASHPNIHALHYSINTSRVANNERRLFKRLFQLQQAATQPYQSKSRRPWETNTRFRKQ